MLFTLKNAFKKSIIVFAVDSVLMVVSMIMYFLCALFNSLGFGVAFLVTGSLQITLRIAFDCYKSIEPRKTFWLVKDFVLIIAVAFFESLVILIERSFNLEYGAYIIFNVLFVAYISSLIVLDIA